MRGISASSLDEVLAAVDAAGGSAGELGDELFGVVATLDATPALRRVLTDPSTEGPAKADLARRVFGDAVSEVTLGVLGTAVQGRWAAGRDLSDGLELAGVAAQVRAAQDAGELDALESELFEIGRLVASDAELRGIVADRTVPVAAKTSLIDSILAGKVAASSLALTRQALVARTGSFERVLEAFADTAAERRGRLLAEVRVAKPLGQSEHDRLAAALSRKYGRDVHLNVVVDPSVVGGISVALADDVVDGTMSTRLEVARRRIAG